MKIVYYEHNSVGHYPVYAKSIIEILNSVGVGVTLIAPTSLINQVKEFMPNSAVDYISLVPLDQSDVFGNRWKRLKYSINVLSNVKNIVRTNKLVCDRFHFGTVFSHELTIGQQLVPKLASQVTGYMVHAPFDYDGRLNIRNLNQSMKYLKLDRIALTDSNRRHMNLLDQSKVKLLPDFADLRLSEPTFIHRSKRTRVLMIGVISERKGVSFLIDLIKATDPNQVEYLIVGPWDAHCERTLLHVARSYSNVTIVNEFVSDGPDFNRHILNSDIVFAAYQDHFHSSNVIIKAKHFGVGFCVSAGGWMEDYAKSTQNGFVVSKQKFDEACLAISEYVKPVESKVQLNPVQEIDKDSVIKFFLN